MRIKARAGRERGVLCDDEHRDSRPGAGTFKQLLARLDTAIASATIDNFYVDEVNVPHSEHTLPPTSRVHLNQSWTIRP